MTIEHLPHSTNALPIVKSEGSECRTVASCKRKLAAYRLTEIRLRGALARNEILLRQKDALIQNQALLSKESDHRLLNDLQVIVSLLSLQSRPGTPLTQSTAVRIKGPTNPRSVGINASQSLFNAKTPNQTRAAESQVFAARETLRVMEQSVLLSAATAYMDVLRDTANLKVQHSSVRVLQQMLKDTRDRRAVGEIPETDVAQAEAQLAGGEATLHAAEATLLATRANYRRIIGIEPSELSPATPVDRLSPPALNASLTQSIIEDPSVTAAMYGVDVSQLQVKIAEAGLYPTLTL
jgi:outer membrane protein TolC